MLKKAKEQETILNKLSLKQSIDTGIFKKEYIKIKKLNKCIVCI